jgi:hypothetical protein
MDNTELCRLPQRPPPGKPQSKEILFTTDYTLLRFMIMSYGGQADGHGYG